MPEDRHRKTEVFPQGGQLKTRPSSDRGWLPARLAPLPRRPAKPAATAGALRLRPGFVDAECSPAELLAVQGSNCAVRLSGIRHFDEGKAARAASVSVGYQVDALNFPIRLEEGAERRFGSTEIQISYKDVFHVVNVVFQSGGRDKADLASARLLRDVQKLHLNVPCAKGRSPLRLTAKLRQRPRAERHEDHARRKRQDEHTYTLIEELIAVESHCTPFPAGPTAT